EKARSHAPHLVIIGGDLAEGGVPSARIEENIKRLVHFGVPIVFVWGNNDYEVRQHKLYSIFKAHGVITLRNESVPFSYN
ncbi:metallophosphoesterase, partial [Staphylococcus aureus]